MTKSTNPENREQTIKVPPSVAGKKKKGSGVFLILLILILLVLVVLFLKQSGKISLFDQDKSDTEVALMNFESEDWKAVFLTNGQVYFGKIKNPNSQYIELYDIYYLQVQNVPAESVQPAEQIAADGTDQTQYQQQTTLVKFGTEIHKPKDKMFINKDHVLFYEDLNADSQIISSVEDYLKSLNSVE